MLLTFPKSTSTWTVITAVMLGLSMTFSPFLLSVGMWGMVAVALVEAGRTVQQATGNWSIKTVLAFSLKRLREHRPFLMLTLLFWLVAISLLWSEYSAFGLERMRVRLPFLVLPWAAANLPELKNRQYAVVIYLLVIALVLLCMGVGVNYLLHEETILKGLGEGQPIPAPRNHIRFSLMVVTGVFAGGWLVSKRAYWQSRKERLFFAGMVVFLFAFLHFLSVRSALVALYATLFFTLVRYLWITRRWKTSLVMLGIIIIIPIVALQTIDSLQQRVAYMWYDWEHFRDNNSGENYSDASRWVSLDVGLHIFCEAPLFGCGIGDFEQKMETETVALYPNYAESPKMPHNQLVYILASTGIAGLLVSLAALLYPLFYRRYRAFYLYMAFQSIVFVSFLVEYTLETSIGAAFYLFYQIWWMLMAVQINSGKDILNA